MRKTAAILFSFAVIVSGCSESTTGGDGGTAGAGGSAGSGGSGGSPSPPPPQAVDQTCRDWCANEPEGPSCHQGPFESVQPCYEDCLKDYQDEAELQCGDDWIAIKDCQIDLDCEDLFGDCDPVDGDFDECVRLANNREFCEANCPEFDITQCEQDTAACRQFAEADRYCETRCPLQDRTECIAQYESSESCAGTGGMGPLVDNTLWAPTTKGNEFFGPPPAGSQCELQPIDCPEYPWPEGECVDFALNSTCIAAFVPECLDPFTVLSVYTRMPDDRVPLCNWITLEQPSLRAIRAGDRVEVRARHSQLAAPVPGEAHIAFVIGDEQVLDYSVTLPTDFEFPDAIWTAPKDYPAGTPLLFHVDNHGQNEYTLIEVNIL